MRLFSYGHYQGVSHTTDQLIKRTLNPLCGLIQQIGYIHRGTHDPRVLIAGADICGVHVAQGKIAPKRGSYHIGGAGIFSNEVLIKCMGESLERYAQLIPNNKHKPTTQWMSYQTMIAEGNPTLAPKYMHYFTEAKLNQKDFPFQKFDTSKPMTWVLADNLAEKDKSIYIPLQLLSVGYQVRKKEGEPWLMSAVTYRHRGA